MAIEHLLTSGIPREERAARIAVMFAGAAISLINEGQVDSSWISRRGDAEALFWLSGSMFRTMRRNFTIQDLILSLRGCPEESDGDDASIFAKLMDGRVMADPRTRDNAVLSGGDRATLSPLWPEGELIAVPGYEASELRAIIVAAASDY